MTQYQRELNHQLGCIEIITTHPPHKHHTTPELNLKTNQGLCDYAGGLALHFNYRTGAGMMRLLRGADARVQLVAER